MSLEVGRTNGAIDRTLEEKKRNGIFYTPDRATRILASWAIRTAHDKVLEPSFGGCGFLAASRDQLNARGCIRPELQLYGCDDDPNAFAHLSTLFQAVKPEGHFVHGDFLRTQPSAFGVLFDVVIGNPPYVSLHNMSETQRKAARVAATVAEVQLSKKASLWAYFIVHSLRFMLSGGRMAWVLPGSFLHSDYSVVVREKLALSFRRSLAVQLEERLFLAEGTEESSVILLCEGYGSAAPCPIELTRAADLDALECIVARWNAGASVGVTWAERTQLELLPPRIRECWDAVVARRTVHQLGEYLTFRIGIVTGANKFFILSNEAAERYRLPYEALQPIVARFSHCRGLELTATELIRLRDAGARCLLFDTRWLDEISAPVKEYMERMSSDEREKNRTFAKRGCWHQPNDRLTPDGFFSAMQTDGPALVLNSAGVTCTNTVYRVFFSRELSLDQQRFLALSVQSTLTQVSAEIEGRSYGSGGLKLEPSEAARISFCMPDRMDKEGVSEAFAGVDRLLRDGNRSEARRVADQLLVATGVVTSEEITIFDSALGQLRSSRRGSGRRRANDK